MNNSVFVGDVLFVDAEEKKNPLTVNSNSSVQPVALMRLGVFVPKQSNGRSLDSSVIDASALFCNLELARSEGYDDIKITGVRLNMDVDFKVWLGIIVAFSKYGLSSNTVELKFTEFAKYCGFPSARSNKRLRASIHESLVRIRGKTISFRRGKALGGYITGLLKTGHWDSDSDTIVLEADSRLWELYKVDYRVILQQHAIRALPKKEAAQALYVFIESLPSNPIPVSFERLRERLMLTSSVGEQNRLIKKAIAQLQDIGYLDASVESKGRQHFLIIHGRNPKLKPIY